MKKIILLFLVSLSMVNAFGQAIENNFPDNFKKSKWKSLEDFNDSTLVLKQELKLIRWNPQTDTLANHPILWIFNEAFNIKYYENVQITKIGNTTHSSRNIHTINCNYSYDADKNIFTLTLDNEDKTILFFKPTFTSSGSFLLLSRVKK